MPHTRKLVQEIYWGESERLYRSGDMREAGRQTEQGRGAREKRRGKRGARDKTANGACQIF